MTRPPRANNTPNDDDAQTLMEIEMASSGRSNAVPREGLVGAHLERREAGEGDEPVGAGAEVAPTKLAAERERERHRLERERGRTPAGTDGALHDKRAPGATREALDEAARLADLKVAGHEMPGRT
jgi:hypothetical protein